ncbi:hypothetical protein LX36DRAFT_674649 [Colletotrichum falcatum]|nr:hypothetical protein LX36DRAFT_674649 [Colletotrichum falcatum]
MITGTSSSIATTGLPQCHSTTPGQSNTTPANTLYVTQDGTGPAAHPIVAHRAGGFLFPCNDGPRGALSPPLVGWGPLPRPAKDQLDGIKYEEVMVPFSDAGFQTYLDAAYDEAIYQGTPTEADCLSSDTGQYMIGPYYDDTDVPSPAKSTGTPSSQ